MLENQLEKLLRKKGVTRYRLWKDLGIDQAQLSRFFKEREGLSLKNLKRIARYLGYDIQFRSVKGKNEKPEK